MNWIDIFFFIFAAFGAYIGLEIGIVIGGIYVTNERGVRKNTRVGRIEDLIENCFFF